MNSVVYNTHGNGQYSTAQYVCIWSVHSDSEEYNTNGSSQHSWHLFEQCTMNSAEYNPARSATIIQYSTHVFELCTMNSSQLQPGWTCPAQNNTVTFIFSANYEHRHEQTMQEMATVQYSTVSMYFNSVFMNSEKYNTEGSGHYSTAQFACNCHVLFTQLSITTLDVLSKVTVAIYLNCALQTQSSTARLEKAKRVQRSWHALKL